MSGISSRRHKAHKGFATISESVALNWIISVPLTNK